MGLIQRISMAIESNLNALVTDAEDPKKILEQTILDMQEDLVQLRQAVAQAIAAQKLQQDEYNKTNIEAENWERRALLAIQKEDESLAREALRRKKAATATAASLSENLERHTGEVAKLKLSLAALESKLSEAKTMKSVLTARLQAANAQTNINNVLGEVNTDSAFATFDRMKEKVAIAEAEAAATAELGMDALELKFAQLEAGSDEDDELAALKLKAIAGSSPSTPVLPPSE
ncbi:Phage shock protein A, PspA [Tumidithrix helvetica PCC 7403]|uniref:PspA/IM30 family protein n=1 Tax=Tumidithrix helvetica TaxID=3457545 RepID=UPI003CB94C22